MGSDSSSRSSGTPSSAPEPRSRRPLPDLERLPLQAPGGGRAYPAAAIPKLVPKGAKTRRGLERRMEHVGSTARAKHVGEAWHEPRRHAAAVRAPVQREVGPSVRILRAGRRRQVRRIADDPIDGPHAVGEVAAHAEDRESLGAGPDREGLEGRPVEIRGYDPQAGPRRVEGERPVPGPDVEEPGRGHAVRERPEQLGVLPGRVHGGRPTRGVVRASD